MKNLDNILVVLVDDDADDREFFADALAEVSAETQLSLFENGILFLDDLKKATAVVPAIIFLDINMPICNGFEILYKIRCSEIWKGLCVIMYSTSNSRKDIDKAFRLGANAFVQKPSSHRSLLQILSRTLRTDWKNPLQVPNERSFVLTPQP